MYQKEVKLLIFNVNRSATTLFPNINLLTNCKPISKYKSADLQQNYFQIQIYSQIQNFF